MESSGPHRKRRVGTLAFAVAFGAIVAYAVGAAWQRLASTARQEAEREAELDIWAHSNLPGAAP